MRRYNRLIAAMTALLTTCVVTAINASVVDNFELLDQRGYAHELYYLSDASAVVLMAHASSCKEGQNAAAVLEELADTYASHGVEVRLINSSLDDNRATIRAAMDAGENGLAVLIDDAQLIGESLELWQAGEAIVIDPGTWRAVYRGDVNGVAATPCSATTRFQHPSNWKKVVPWRSRSNSSGRPTRASLTPIPSRRC